MAEQSLLIFVALVRRALPELGGRSYGIRRLQAIIINAASGWFITHHIDFPA
jgi:hypothetical protein